MDSKKQARQLAQEIRSSMAHARPEHKQRFADLLERTLAEATLEPLSREELEVNLTAAEQLVSEFSLISKQNHYVLNEVEQEINMVMAKIPNALNERYAQDIKSAIEQAVVAIRQANAELFQVEREIKAQAQRIGWDIHDADSEAIAESGPDGINQRAYDLGYRCFQTRHTACPFKKNTPNQRSWIEGFTAAANQESQR